MQKALFLLFISLISTSMFLQGSAKENMFRELENDFKLFDRSSVKSAQTEYPQLTDGSLLTLNLQQLRNLKEATPRSFHLSLPTHDGGSLELELERMTIFSKGFNVKTKREGIIKDVDLGIHYRGIMNGSSTSLVTISIYENEIVGALSDGLSNYELVKLRKKSNQYILYKTKDLKEKYKRQMFGFDCGIEEGRSGKKEIHDHHINRSTDNCTLVEIYFVLDYSFYQDNNSDVSTATTRVTSIFAQTTNVYEAENINVAMSGVFIWDVEDPFDETGSTAVELPAFRSYYNNEGAGWPGDLAHLISGSNGSSASGRAYVSALCGVSNYGLTRVGVNAPIEDWTSYSRVVKVVTHEIGHNFSSLHTHACVWNDNNTQIDDYGNIRANGNIPDNTDGANCFEAPGILDVTPTIMSYYDTYGHGNDDFPMTNGFGSQPGDKIRNGVATASCLGEGNITLPEALCKNAIVSLNSQGTITINPIEVDNGSNDAACTNFTLSVVPNTFDCSNVGTNSVTLTITDNQANTATCNATVTVNDTENPTISCPADITVGNDADLCGAVVSYTNPIGVDNCTGASTVQTIGIGTNNIFPVGTTTETFTVTDASENTASCSFTVTVNDVIAPSIICPDDVTVNVAPGQCGQTVDFSEPVANDECGLLNGIAIFQPASGDFFSVGTTNVNCSIVDQNNNTGSCSFTVTVNDNENPTAICPANISQSNDTGDCGAIINFTLPDATDNCPNNITQSADISSGSFFDVGTTQVTVTSTDEAGNTDQCTFDVIINDTENPSISCPDDITVGNDPGLCEAVVNYTAPTGMDNCIGATVDLAMGAGPNKPFPVGISTETFIVTDNAGNTANCSFSITVNDTEAPTAGCPDDIVVPTDLDLGGAIVSVMLPDAADNCSGVTQIPTNINAFYAVGTSSVIATATDAAGNTANCTFNITVEDVQDPTMLCSDLNINLLGSTVSITTDQIDGGSFDNWSNLSLSLDQNTFDCSSLGLQIVTLTGTDEAGNTASCKANVTITDINPPTAICANPSIALTSENETSIGDPLNLDGGSFAVCGGVMFSTDEITFTCSDVGNTVPVTLTVTSVSSGLSATCISNISVIDPNSFCCDAPIASCNDFTLVLDNSGLGEISIEDVASNSFADCGLADENLSTTSFDCTNIGQISVVTYTITDINGISDNCTANITIEGLPCGWTDTDGINCDGENDTSYDPNTDTYTLTSDGCSSAHPYTSDSQSGVYHELCGDGYIKALVTNVDGNGFAGVELRNSLDPGAKKIGIGTNTVTKILRMARILDNYPAWPQEMFSLDKFWVKIERNGPYFKALASADDITYIPYLFQAIQMDDCTQVGLFVYSKVPGEVVTADITNVEIGQGSSSLETLSGDIAISTIAPIDLNVGLSPNPAKEEVRIDLNRLIGQNVNISIYNINGQLMTNHQIDYVEDATKVIALDRFPSGTYYVNIKTAQQQQTLKLIKQ